MARKTPSGLALLCLFALAACASAGEGTPFSAGGGPDSGGLPAAHDPGTETGGASGALGGAGSLETSCARA